MKTTRVYYAQIICILILFLMTNTLLSGILPSNPQYDDGCEAFREGWKVQVGEELKSYDALPQILTTDGQNEIRLNRTVQGADTIGLFAFQQQIYVYLDGEEILCFAPDEKVNSKMPGNGWQFIELSAEDVGKELSIRIVQCYKKNQVNIPVLYHGTRMSIVSYYLRSKAFFLLISLIGVMIGLFLLLVWGIAGKSLQLNKGLPWLAVFAIFIGTWSAIEANVYSFFFDKLLPFSWFSYICLKMSVVPFLLFVNYTFHNGSSKLLRGLIVFSCAEFWISGVLQFTGILDYADTAFITHGILCVASAYIMVTAIPKPFLEKQKREGITDRKVTYLVHSIFIVVVAVTSMIDMYRFYFGNNPDVALYSRVGYFGYVLAVTIASLMDFISLIVMGKQAALIKKEASIDAMTKLRNRAEFEKDITKISAKNSKNIGIIVFDLNNLKKFNDEYGHDMGDYYIIIGSEVIQDIFSLWGNIYRIGGDEFCGIVKELTEQEFMTERERMEKRMQALLVPGYDFHMEISSGYAIFDSGQDKYLKDTMKRADARMYQRKKELKES
ncbi:MAG: GGDEF domain-containing protein [Bacteroides sp.]|nr:GGDEF domain-containing protein [Bacteroides sp.]MCM1550769.1 GGDEF domain-containing protein [Clostridium sp.]